MVLCDLSATDQTAHVVSSIFFTQNLFIFLLVLRALTYAVHPTASVHFTSNPLASWNVEAHCGGK
jgi:hypothetical protein